MKDKKKKKESVFTFDVALNPVNTDKIRSYSSCEDRCNKLDVNRKKTHNSYG